MFKGVVTVYVDGGCTRNGSPDAEAYGSYRLVATDEQRNVVKVLEQKLTPYPQHHTNNAAEIQTMINALEKLLEKAGSSKVKYPVTVFSDSQLVVKWLDGTFTVNADHLIPLVNYARELAKRFEQLDIHWVPREEIYEVLGH